MKLIRGLYNIPTVIPRCVVTMGNFDGVHCGHQVLLARVKEQAQALQAASVVITFEPQPAEFFAQSPVPRLTRWREKYQALAQYGIDYLLVLRFDATLAKLPAADFMQKMLLAGINMQHIIVGNDFRFGYQRQGDVAFLQKIGNQHGFSVESLSSVLINGQRVSSTAIRQALAAAQHDWATQLLGRPYALEGRIVHGDQRGRSIGFPTANINLHRKVAALQGVYIVRMHGLGDNPWPGVANIGTRPTVGGMHTILEVHLLDFDQVIYGRYVSVEFCQKLRGEQRFEQLADLQKQIQLDVQQARAYHHLSNKHGHD